jgi:hypothetical protein
MDANMPAATAINDISASNTHHSTPTYDLKGRVVENPKRGIYIKNGKKYIVK